MDYTLIHLPHKAVWSSNVLYGILAFICADKNSSNEPNMCFTVSKPMQYKNQPHLQFKVN